MNLFKHSLAILLSFPLTIYPAIRITETCFGNSSGKSSLIVKWQKNIFRAILVIMLGLIAYLEREHLSIFISLVGSFCCIPLMFIYPSLFHFKISKSIFVRCKDVLLVVFGIFTMFFTTYITLQELMMSNN